MAIQNRRGIHTDFDATKMVAGEFAVVQSGDPNNTNGTSVYICFQNGSAKRLTLIEDLDTVVGSLSNLETTDKTSVVDAINELAEKSSILFGTSSTGGSTRDKVVTCSDFEAVDGALIAITVSQTNTVTNARFNVNGTGAKSIYSNHEASTDTSWLTKGTYLFVYNSINGGRFTLIGATERIASDTAPLMNGTAAVGTSKKYARADHVHPSDTSRATVATLTAETNARTNADNAINGEITQLKEDLTEFTGKKSYTYAKNKSINYTNPLVQSTENGWESVIVSCVEGDVFYVKGFGGNNTRLWFFSDSNGAVLSVSDAGVRATEYIELIAPTGAVHLSCNNWYAQSYDGRLVYESNSTIVVDASGDGDYTSFTEAIYENVDDGRDIVVKAGTYDIVAEYIAIFGQTVVDNLADATSGINNFQYGIRITNRKVTFESGAHLVCDWTGHTVNATHRFCALRVEPNAELIGIDLDCTATFYCIHDDYGTNDNSPFTIKYENCRVIGHNLYNANCIGGGAHKYSRHIIDNCYFNNNVDSSDIVLSADVRYHNTNTADAEPELYVSNCYFSNNMNVTYYGTQTTKMRAYVNNCYAPKGINKRAESSTMTTDNVELYAWNNQTS